MQIQHKRRGNDGIFYIEEQGVNIAEMTYRVKEEKTMVINHTEVSEQFRGKNIGVDLVEAGVEFARREHLKILPLCVFAKAILEKNESFKDVL